MTNQRKLDRTSRSSRFIGSFVVIQAALLWDCPYGTTTTKSCPFVASAFVAQTHARAVFAGNSNLMRQSGIALGGQSDDKNESFAAVMDLTDIKILNDLVVASSLSYLSSDVQDGSTLSKMESSAYFSKAPLNALAQVVEPKTESGATIFEYNNDDSTTDKTLVVACRGSATPINFSTNLRFKLVPLEPTDGEQNSGQVFLVHEGFQDATAGLWDLLRPLLEQLRTNNDSNYDGILFTGHSLGSANAQLCATRYQSEAAMSIPLAGVVSFGGPRLVNRALAEHWNNGLLEDVVVANYVHDRDPILRQNGPLWDSLGFGIVGTEIPCEPYEALAYHSAVEQAEQAKKMPPLAWNILDHCNYLGVFVGPRLV